MTDLENTRCPYLGAAKGGALCDASPVGYAPDEERSGEYCVTEEHYRCSTLLGRLLRGGGPRPAAHH